MEYSIRKIQKNISKAALVCMIGACPLFMQDGSASEVSKDESIEIISGGIKYDSIKTYKEAEQKRNEKKIVSKSDGFEETSGKYIQALLKDIQRRSPGSLNSFSVMPNIWNVNADQYPTLCKVGIGIEPIQFQSSEEDDKTYDPFLQSYVAISRIGFNTGVNKVIEDFQAENGHVFSYKRLKSKDLEMVLSQSITKNGYQGPVLLMSNKKKLRIMTLQPQEKDDISNIP
jgi:hypothetical protein